MGFFKDLKNRTRGLEKRIQGPMIPMPAPIPQEMSLNPISLPRFKLEKRISDELPPEYVRGRQAPGTVLDLETGLPPVRPPLSNLKNIGNSVRRLPQIMPERMPSRRPTPRFFGGGLGSIFARLPNQRVREGVSPPLPRAPLPMPQDMPRERFPMMRPGFAEGEEIDMRKIFAEQAARQGISPPEVATQKLKQFLGETGRTVSNRDAELYGMGVLTLEDIIDRATDLNVQEIIGDSRRTISDMDRNLLQQEQMFFPDSGRTISNMEMNSLDDILADLEKKN